MKRLLLGLSLLAGACGAPDATTRGAVDEPPGQATSTVDSTALTDTRSTRGAMETQAEAPAGPDSNVDTSVTTTQSTTAPPP